jgi:predicted MFS family arabinose efflux permease
MSLYAVAFFAGMPVGALIEGWVADLIGPMNTFLCAGVAVCAAGMLYLRALPGIRTASRPLYIRLGLIKS